MYHLIITPKLLCCWLATCEMCGMVGVRDAFYSKTKRFCSVSCSRSYSSNSKKASILARLQVTVQKPSYSLYLLFLWLSPFICHLIVIHCTPPSTQFNQYVTPHIFRKWGDSKIVPLNFFLIKQLILDGQSMLSKMNYECLRKRIKNALFQITVNMLNTCLYKVYFPVI